MTTYRGIVDKIYPAPRLFKKHRGLYRWKIQEHSTYTPEIRAGYDLSEWYTVNELRHRCYYRMLKGKSWTEQEALGIVREHLDRLCAVEAEIKARADARIIEECKC